MARTRRGRAHSRGSGRFRRRRAGRSAAGYRSGTVRRTGCCWPVTTADSPRAMSTPTVMAAGIFDFSTAMEMAQPIRPVCSDRVECEPWARVCIRGRDLRPKARPVCTLACSSGLPARAWRRGSASRPAQRPALRRGAGSASRPAQRPAPGGPAKACAIPSHFSASAPSATRASSARSPLRDEMTKSIAGPDTRWAASSGPHRLTGGRTQFNAERLNGRVRPCTVNAEVPGAPRDARSP